MKRVSIIIPVYDEENYIIKTLKAVSNSNTLKYSKEIIVVDDGSQDKTVIRVQEYIKKERKGASIRLIKKNVNEGKGAALKAGFLKSSGDIVIVQDADLEYIPADYPTLLQPFIDFDADVVYGSRFVSGKPHRIVYYWHHVANKFLTILSNMLTNLNFTDMETGYKVFKGPLIRKIAPKLESQRFGFEPEITARIAKERSAKGNLKIYEVGISYMGRTYEEGKKINWVDGVRAIEEIITFNVFR